MSEPAVVEATLIVRYESGSTVLYTFEGDVKVSTRATEIEEGARHGGPGFWTQDSDKVTRHATTIDMDHVTIESVSPSVRISTSPRRNPFHRGEGACTEPTHDGLPCQDKIVQ